MTDLRLLDDALDRARVVDDFVRGVIGLGDGQLGGIDTQSRSWSQRLFGRVNGPKGIAQGLAASYGPEQLRKAANAADELAASVDELGRAEGAIALAAHIDIVEAGIDQVSARLRDPDLTSRSPQLREIHATLSRALGALTEARSRVLLAQIRGHAAGGSHEPPR